MDFVLYGVVCAVAPGTIPSWEWLAWVIAMYAFTVARDTLVIEADDLKRLDKLPGTGSRRVGFDRLWKPPR